PKGFHASFLELCNHLSVVVRERYGRAYSQRFRPFFACRRWILWLGLVAASILVYVGILSALCSDLSCYEEFRFAYLFYVAVVMESIRDTFSFDDGKAKTVPFL